MPFFKTEANRQTKEVETMLSMSEQLILAFRNGVQAYLEGDRERFESQVSQNDQLYQKLSELNQNLINELYLRPMASGLNSTIADLIGRVYSISQITHECIQLFYAESPMIPEELKNSFIKLNELASLAGEASIPASRAFFMDIRAVKDKLNKINFYVLDCEQQALRLKYKIFHDFPDLKLSQKIHLRYFTLHIEKVAKSSGEIASFLNLISLKLLR